jgi:hypothetical protein
VSRRLPEGSRSDFPFIQPWLDTFLDQLLTDSANGWLVLAVVAQEDIKDFRFGHLCAHPEAILYGQHEVRQINFAATDQDVAKKTKRSPSNAHFYSSQIDAYSIAFVFQ